MAALYRSSPGFEAHFTPEWWMVLSGGEHCIFNWMVATSASAESAAALRSFTERLRSKGLNGLVYWPRAIDSALTPLIRELGLREPGAIPLMVRDTSTMPDNPTSQVRSSKVTDAAGLREAMAVMSATFDVPLDQANRCMPADILTEPAVAVYAARNGEKTVGMVAATRFGDSCSIDIMGVAPERQRQGIGRALLQTAMHDQMLRGVRWFHLIASPDGVPLYGATGFKPVLDGVTRMIPAERLPAAEVVTLK